MYKIINKKIFMLIILILLLAVGSCTIDEDTGHLSKNVNKDGSKIENPIPTRAPLPDPCIPGTSDVFLLESISAEDGVIIAKNSLGKVVSVRADIDGTELDPMYTGRFILGDTYFYRTFLSFDTSEIPDCATITYINLFILWENHHTGEPDFDYMRENLAIDIAPATGFNGEYALTTKDFLAASASSLPVYINPAIGGLVLHINSDGSLGGFIPYIVKDGKTQLRLRFQSNPLNRLYTIRGINPDEPPYLGTSGKPVLLIGWEVR